jgi:hypothetical protein
MIAVNGSAEDRPIYPDEIRAVRAYVEKHRADQDPFDLVIIDRTENDGSQAEQDRLQEFKAAGVTWWMEELAPPRFPTIEEVRKRLHKGPPGIR